MNLRNDLFKVFGSNIVTIFVGIVSGLVIPSFLSLNQYAYLKTFTLYLSYVGILQLGFADGLFVKYGGSYEQEVDKSLLKGEHHFFLIFQFIITISIMLLSLLLKDKLLFAFSLSIIPFNLITFYKYFYQSIGKFNIYTKILIFPQIIILVTNLMIIFIFEINDYWMFVFARLFAFLFTFFILEYNFYKLTKKNKLNFNIDEIKSLFSIGFFIMLGNLSFILYYSIDRWFVKILFTSSDFAFYSFAISMMAMIKIFVNSITNVFYPYLSRNDKFGILHRLKKYLIIIASLSSGSYFVFSYIIINFIPKYIPSLNIISILFASFPAIIIIKVLYVNLYKIRKSDKQYIKTVIYMLLVSIILNLIAFYLFKSYIAIAAATTISFYVWYYFSSKHFESLLITFKEVKFLIMFISLFIYTTSINSYLLGAFTFIIGLSILIFLFYKLEFISLINEILNKVKK